MNVFDFDNTIYDGESAIDFFKFYMRRDPSLIKYAPRVMYALVKYKRGKISIEQALNDYGGEVSEYYRRMTSTKQTMCEFWDKHEKKIRPFYKQIQREDDLIISASPEDMLEPICKRLGIKYYIGTAMDPDTCQITRLCFRENKVKAYRDIYGDTPIDCFYTDSMNDAPLIELSREAYLVKGDTVKRIK